MDIEISDLTDITLQISSEYFRLNNSGVDLIGHADEDCEIVKGQPWSRWCVCCVSVSLYFQGPSISWELEKGRKWKQYKQEVLDIRSLSSRDSC